MFNDGFSGIECDGEEFPLKAPKHSSTDSQYPQATTLWFILSALIFMCRALNEKVIMYIFSIFKTDST